MKSARWCSGSDEEVGQMMKSVIWWSEKMKSKDEVGQTMKLVRTHLEFNFFKLFYDLSKKLQIFSPSSKILFPFNTIEQNFPRTTVFHFPLLQLCILYKSFPIICILFPIKTIVHKFSSSSAFHFPFIQFFSPICILFPFNTIVHNLSPVVCISFPFNTNLFPCGLHFVTL